MDSYSIDELLSDVANTLNLPNGEKIRNRVLMDTKYILKKIGIRFTGVLVEEEFEIAEHKIRIPSNVIEVLNVRRHENRHIEHHRERYINIPYQYNEQYTDDHSRRLVRENEVEQFRLYTTNYVEIDFNRMNYLDRHHKALEISPTNHSLGKLDYYQTGYELTFPNNPYGHVIIDYYSFALDKDGGLMINEIDYKACLNYCIYNQLLISTVNPLKSNTLLYKQEYQTAVLEATATYNHDSPKKQSYIRHVYASKR